MKFDLERVQQIIKEVTSFRAVARALGTYSHTSYKRIADEHGIDYSHFTHGKINKGIEGQKFGKLTVLEILDNRRIGSKMRAFCRCKCECGTVCTKRLDGVKSQRVTSCGCAVVEKGRFMLGNQNPAFAGVGELCAVKYADIIRSAGRRNIEFSVSMEYLWDLFLKQDRKCTLSGIDLFFGPASKPLQTNASLDRIDSSRGYVEGNVQWVHKDINLMKRSFSQDYFVELCKLIGANYAK